MKEYITRLLQGFEYNSPADWFYSLAPSYKYSLVTLSIGVSAVATMVETFFGFSYLAFVGFLLVMMLEVLSGIWASRIKREHLSSRRMSRFTFKCAVYVVLIAVPFLFSESYHARGKDLAAEVFDWIHIFFTIQIMVENIISILENYAVITGKDKTHWINKIQNKAEKILS